MDGETNIDGRAQDLGAEAVRRFAIGELPAEEFHEAFRTASVYCVRGNRPGLVAYGDRGAGIIPVFSCLAELAAYAIGDPKLAERGVDWFSTTGEDLLDQWPTGYALALDPAGANPVTLSASAIRRETVLSLRRRDGEG